MPGITDIADDIFSKGNSEINHDIAVLSLLETAQNNNLKFNPDKIQCHEKRMQVPFGSGHATLA